MESMYSMHVCVLTSVWSLLNGSLSTMQEMWVQSLHWKDPLEKEMATHSSILDWEIPWIEESGGLQSTGLQKVGYDLATKQQ